MASDGESNGECRLNWLLAFLAAIYVPAIVGLAVFQRRFLYFPVRRLTHPAEAGMSGVEELRLMSNDGETLVAWHVPPSDGHPLILYFQGNGGALSTAFHVSACSRRAGTGFSPFPIAAMAARPDRQRKQV
jgi:hypothetical protein